MTLGDVLAAVSIIVTTGFAVLWAMILSALLFPKRTTAVASDIESHPWKCVLAGTFFGVPLVLIGLVLFQIPNPLARILGVFVFLVVLLLAAAGSGGLARLVGQRISSHSKLTSPFASISLGSFLIAGSAILPLVGWFLIAPLFTLCALGAGVRGSMSHKKESSQIQVSEVS